LAIEFDSRAYWLDVETELIPSEKGLRYAAIMDSYYYWPWTPFRFGKTDLKALHWCLTSLVGRNVLIQSMSST
jgi:hypothetical protein